MNLTLISALETPLNISFQRTAFLILLGAALVCLPACGSKSEVRSEKANETVLNAEVTPTATVAPITDIGMPADNGSAPKRTIVEKIHRSNVNKTTKITVTSTATASTPSATTPVVTATDNNANQTPMETSVPIKKKNGSHWFLWFLVLVALAVAGWYFWSKYQENSDHPDQPKPPVGGLSPVSGFTGRKGRALEEKVSKPSIWSKKLF